MALLLSGNAPIDSSDSADASVERNSPDSSPGNSTMKPSNSEQPSPPPRQGINVVGHLRSSAGLGNTTRTFIRMLKRNGYPVVAYDIESYAANETDGVECRDVVKDLNDLPYNHNLIIACLECGCGMRTVSWIRGSGVRLCCSGNFL